MALRLAGEMSKRDLAQKLALDAMELIADDETKAVALCRKALDIYPDCVDARMMLAELKCQTIRDTVGQLRAAVQAGRRDLGPTCFKEDAGHFWGLLDTRPFMRAMAQLAFALLDWGTPQRVDEAVRIFQEMLELNPNDNQGVRDWLAGCYLARKRYEDAAALFKRYPDDWLAAPVWAKVLLAYVTEGEPRAAELLEDARIWNRHAEKYLNGSKRLPRKRPGAYSPGEESEAVECALMLSEAWKAHPKARQWLRSRSAGGGNEPRP